MWIERLVAAVAVLALGLGVALALRGGGSTDGVAAEESEPPGTAGSAPAGRARSRVRVAAVGDIALLGAPPGGGSSLFAGVGEILAGDVVLGNLEGTLSTGGVSKCRPRDEEDEQAASACFAFQAPPEIATHFAAAGFTVLNVANNHANDYGATGLQQTLDAVRAAGIEPTGQAGSVAFATIRRSPSVRPTTVAVLGFAPYAVANPLTDIDAAKEIVRRAGSRADVVVVTMHAGAEGADRAHVAPGAESYLGENRGDVVAFSHGVVDAGADLVLGHGPHVLRGMELYRDRLIAYSLGNFASHRALNTAGDTGISAVLTSTLAPDGRFLHGRIRPVLIASTGVPAPGGGAVGRIRELSDEDFGAAAPRIRGNGQVLPP